MYQTKFDVYFGKQVKLNKKHTGFYTTPTLEIVTARSLGQGYIFTGVCHSVNRGGLPGRPPQGDPPARETPSKETPPTGEIPQGEPPLGDPSKETPLPGRHPIQAPTQGGKLRGIRSRSTAKGEIEGDQIQAHTQGGN